MNRWSDARRIRRALAVPFVGVFVGLFLTATSSSTRTPHVRGAEPSVESASVIFECTGGFLHSPAAAVDAQRRVATATSDLQAADAPAFVGGRRATMHVPARHDARADIHVARGYDATAPPLRFV